MKELNNNQIERSIQETAEGIQPNAMFTAELEEKLRKAHKPRKAWSFSMRGFAPIATGVAVLGALTFFMVWLLNTVNLQPTPGDEFACPVTPPNGSLPPGETINSPFYLGNGELWTSLWPDGKVYMEPHNQEADGSFSMKWGFVRAVTGPLTIEGRRLDAEAEPLRSFITDGYGDTGLQITALIFPTTGCWEVTARVGESSLTFVTEVVFGEEMPKPEPTMFITTDETFEYEVQEGDTCAMLADRYGITISELMALNGLQECTIFVGMKLLLPVRESVPAPPQEGGYDWQGNTLYLNAPMPESPADMKIFLSRDETHATVEDVQALADQFKMIGEIYETQGEIPDTTDYMVIDGNRRLRVRSNWYFTYNPNYAEAAIMNVMDHPDATALIDDFMKTYGFDDEYRIERTDDFTYNVMPLTPDGYVIRLANYFDNGLKFRFNQNGIVSVEANLLQYDELQTVQVISAQEAFDRLIDPAPLHDNLLKATSISLNGVRTWMREEPLDETITYVGWLYSTGQSVTGSAPYIALNEYPVTGNIEGISENLAGMNVEATGYFHEEDGTRTFVMESWQPYPEGEIGYIGTITADGDSYILTTADGMTLTLTDLPTDLPLPAVDVYVTGVTQGDTFHWRTIYNGPLGGGGGGGGGLGFFKLNLSGTPIPLPTLAPTPTPEPVSTEPIEGLRGIVSVITFERPDGTQRKEYSFVINQPDTFSPNYYILEGDNLDDLDAYHNRPIDLWGQTLQTEPNSPLTIQVERYEVPYPDLQFQLLTGKQTLATIEGQPVTIFTTADGAQYITLYSDGLPSNTLMGLEDEDIILEVLMIPDETFGGYPAIRVFGGSPATNPATGEVTDYEITADQPIVVDGNPQLGGYTATIEKIELVYYTPDTRYGDQFGQTEPPYIQPVWRFSGHYSNGDGFEILMQAVRDEYLLPTHVTEP